ncbi:hypothetical protein HDV01_000911 [Terramyces sp. JEL0728]|nr:hypothetical protein HDV01_000911 [Terramyces sp. JEL0728]
MKRKHGRIIFYLALIIFILSIFNQLNTLKLSEEEQNNLNFNIRSDNIDFSGLKTSLTTFKSIHDEIYTSSLGYFGSLYFYDDSANHIESSLFPWLKKHENTIRLRKSFKGDGIVMSVNNRYTHLALSTILMIRKVHKCNLPVEIFYIGEQDLSMENQNTLNVLPNTKTIDITKIFNNDILKLDGWDSKPFALLASSFRNAMIIDADTVFLQSPELLFKNKLYLENGALFFQDRTAYSLTLMQQFWIEIFLHLPLSDYARDLRIMKGDTAHQQESGVVLIDKTRRLPGLLATCTLNAGSVKEETYEHVHGDKETFWLGFEAVGEQYIFNPTPIGTLGKKEYCGSDSWVYSVCSAQILHSTEDGPMWINGGIIHDKFNSTNAHIIEPTHYVHEPGEWSFSGKVRNLACLYTNSTPEVIPISVQNVLVDSGKIWLDIAKSQ